MEFTFPLADLERLELLLNDINGTSYIHERLELLRERAMSDHADRLEKAFEDLQIYAGFLLTREETIRAIWLSGRSKP